MGIPSKNSDHYAISLRTDNDQIFKRADLDASIFGA